jgi:hypothetical protein
LGSVVGQRPRHAPLGERKREVEKISDRPTTQLWERYGETLRRAHRRTEGAAAALLRMRVAEFGIQLLRGALKKLVHQRRRGVGIGEAGGFAGLGDQRARRDHGGAGFCRGHSVSISRGRLVTRHCRKRGECITQG